MLQSYFYFHRLQSLKNNLIYNVNLGRLNSCFLSIMDSEKKLFPNVDFYGGLLLSELGFAVDVFTPIFVAGRSVGWSAHYFEQRSQDTLIRPAAKYTGIEER